MTIDEIIEDMKIKKANVLALQGDSLNEVRSIIVTMLNRYILALRDVQIAKLREELTSKTT